MSEYDRIKLRDVVNSVGELAINVNHTVGIYGGSSLGKNLDEFNLEQYFFWTTSDKKKGLERNSKMFSELLRLRWNTMCLDKKLVTNTIWELHQAGLLSGQIKIFILSKEGPVIFNCNLTNSILAIAPRVMRKGPYKESEISSDLIDEIGKGKYVSEEVEQEIITNSIKERLMGDEYYESEDKEG